MRYSLRWDAPSLVFTAWHSVTLAGVAEPLHQHTFRVILTIISGSGALDEDGVLIDFRLVEGILLNVLAEVDGSVLDIKPSASAECVAEFLLQKIIEQLNHKQQLTFKLELEEEQGCWGIVEL